MKNATGERTKRDVADRLHSVAIHLLRRVRNDDPASGLSPSRLSALSVVIYAGPIRLSDLAAAEQVRPPTMTRLIQGLEDDGLVRRKSVSDDARAWSIEATAKGKRVLESARERRLAKLGSLLSQLSNNEISRIEESLGALEKVIE